ncbi:MAG: chaperonin GroEL, partial [candidate division Zixibacteria bacterium]|nr:chaperonin GroEL [candidate division Zixibacteria bacterium]
MKEKKARVEDALHATRAAVEEGIIPGGGVALIRAISVLDDVKVEEDEMIGVNIVRKALEAPIRLIAENAGAEGSVVANRVKGESGAIGFNAKNEKYEDLIEAGVIDPTKVARTALENAASISALLLTTEAIITDLPEKEGAAAGVPGGMPPGGMGGMY